MDNISKFPKASTTSGPPRPTMTQVREHSKGKGQEAARFIYEGGVNNTQRGTAMLRTAPDTALATTACLTQMSYLMGSWSGAVERLTTALEKHS